MLWTYPPSPLNLPDDTIHIWKVNLDISSSHLKTFYELLCSEERQRADRYRLEEPRNRFIVARAILRLLLGRYTHVPPDQIVLGTNLWGKPMLAACMDTNVEFNVAHSQNLAIYAFARHNAVGIDVEFVRPIDNIDHLVTQFFSARERQTFEQIPQALQLQAFFKGWTRKEAYIKGRGKGLSIPLNAFDVTLAPGEVTALLADRTDVRAVQHWKLQDIEIKPQNGYTAAFAFETGMKAFAVVGYTLNPETGDTQCDGTTS